MLVRERLLERLRERWSVPVTVVTAPAGYGKTTLLAQAVAADQADPARLDWWLTCRAHGTLEALRDGLGTISDPVTPEGGGADDVASAVGEAMRRLSPQQVCLVLDDVHVIARDPEATGCLAAVLAGLPPNGHVVLAGRVPLPPPLLLALDGPDSPSGGGLRHLGQADLELTEGEVAAFAALRGVSVATVAGCGGWPALAELSVGAPWSLRREYLEQEVLSALPPAARRRLAVLAHLGSFDDDVARAALGGEPGETDDAEVEAVDVAALVAGLPLVDVDEAGNRTFHPLWRTLLAREVPPAEIASAQRRAAARHRERGQAAAAVSLLIDAGAEEELSRAVVEALVAPRPSVPRELLAGWLTQLPTSVRTGPSGQLLAAVVATETDPDGAWQRLEGCVATFRALRDTTGELASIVHLGEQAWWAERSDTLAGVARRILELAADGCEEAVALTPVSRAILADRPVDAALPDLLDAVPDQPISESPGDGRQAVVSAFESISLLQRGHAEEALDCVERALADAGPVHAPLIEATRLLALRCQGRVGEVLDALPDVLRRVEETGYRHAAALAAAHGGLVHALRGDRGQAEAYLARARGYVSSTEAPMVHTALAIAEATVAVAAGDETAASAGLAAELARHPLDEGLPAGPYRWNIALIYVLVPETRPAWERAELGPALAVARDLARAVVAAREGGQLPPDAPPFPETALVQAHLPRRWMAELATAAVAADREDGHRLLEATWPEVGPAVAELADEDDHPLVRGARTIIGRLAVPPTERLELRLLGPLELWRGGAPVHATDWRRERVRSLLAYLALHGSVSREQLVRELWPDLDADSQERNYRVTLTYLLRVIEPQRPPRGVSYFVRQVGSTVVLDAGDRLTVDVWEFDVACERADDAFRRGSPDEALTHALTAVELWRGDATHLASATWAVTPLEQRRIRFVTTATRAAQLLVERGSFERGCLLAERVLALDPWREDAHRIVVAGHRAAGNRRAVKHALGRYRAALDELGVSPHEAQRMTDQLLASLPPDLQTIDDT